MAAQAEGETTPLAADEAGIAQAARLLRAGSLVAFPTETVYGLGADATSPQAVAGIYAAKERPRFNPLIAHLPDVDGARREGVFGPDAARLAEAFWPGPLTLVVPASDACSVSDLARAGLDSVALRVPAAPVARRLIAAVGRPVAAPSANRSGRLSPTTADHVRSELHGRIAAILDGGATPVGLESTIVACLPGAPPRLLRPGGLAREAIEAALGRPVPDAQGEHARAPRAPGRLASHYAPAAAVRLDATAISPGEAALLFGSARPTGLEYAAAVVDLSPTGDLREAAAGLFSALRHLDRPGIAVIAVSPIPAEGLGEAIRDRLLRASAPRPP